MAISIELERIENSIIHAHRELFDESPSPMKLQKLCYYAKGYALAMDRELFPEDFQAWQHGPVIPSLYGKYKEFQWHQINIDVPSPYEPEKEYIYAIVSAYGRYDGAALSTMTHRESPWLEARGDLDESQGSDVLISQEALKDFFKAKLRANG